jgi:hypothetical protein
MQNLINNLIENKGNNYFEFYCNSNNPVRHLKEQTSSVPDKSGLYLVFSKKRNDEFCESCAHLNYEIELERNELLYFGKAGGVTNKGRIIRQGLNGRINNVISDSSRNLKDIKRANYWNIVMNDFNFIKFIIIYYEHDNPQVVENTIYNFLDESNLKYPLMNKRRGR